MASVVACYHPLEAWQGPEGGPVTLGPRGPDGTALIHIPCGKCVGCAQVYAQAWATRIYHESLEHRRNCFVTLTYDPARHEGDFPLILNYRHFQDLVRRIRKRRALSDKSEKFKYFVAGEYGKGLNPHYHACFMGHDFPDQKYYGKSNGGFPMWTSKDLDELWPHGQSWIQELTFGSARYCAKYACKRIYRGVDHVSPDGEKMPREFVNMSLKPAIGKAWLEKYWTSVYKAREGVVPLHDGIVVKAPRYYDKLYFDIDGNDFNRIVYARKDRAVANALRTGDCTPRRLLDREAVVVSKLKTFGKEWI